MVHLHWGILQGTVCVCVCVCVQSVLLQRATDLFVYSGLRRFLRVCVCPALPALQFIRTLKTNSVEICNYYAGLQYPQNIQLENLTILISG